MALTNRERNMRYRTRHLERIKARQTKWYYENRERIVGFKKKYNLNHVEQILFYRFGRFGTKCAVCGEKRVLDVCHIIPERLGGPRKIWNILRLCPTHHRLFDKDMLTIEEKEPIAEKISLACNKFKLWKMTMAAKTLNKSAGVIILSTSVI